MKRRTVLQAAAVASKSFGSRPGDIRGHDVAVIGAGVFGAWTAWTLHQAGKKVALIDKHSPAHSGASSGGESRVTRSSYGDDDVYSDWAYRSLDAWKSLSETARLPLFHQLGVLRVHELEDPFVKASKVALTKLQIPFHSLSAAEIRSQYPVMKVAQSEAAIFEPLGGGLMARRAVQTLVAQAVAEGMDYMTAEVQPVSAADGEAGSMKRVMVWSDGREQPVVADAFVMACGPWLDQVCPDAMAGKLFVTRQEVFFFNAGRDLTGALPVWSAGDFYGFPDIEGRGFKVADDTHGERVNPDTQDRRTSEPGLQRAREFLSERFPGLADSPLSETRVCQYENSSNGHFVIDRHPGLDNVWLVGGGSGHGFKHGPALGAHVAGLITGAARPISLFSLASKADGQNREVH